MSDESKWPEEPAERVQELVEGVLDELDLDGEVEIKEDDERIEAVISGDDDYGLLIGKRGQTIDALQLLAFQAAFRGLGTASGSCSMFPATGSGGERCSPREPTGLPSRHWTATSRSRWIR